MVKEHPVSLELVLIGFIVMAGILSSLWLITEDVEDRPQSTFYKTNKYLSITVGFVLVGSISIAMASKQTGFGFIMLILSSVLFGELLKNLLTIEDKTSVGTLSQNDKRIFVASNLVQVFGIVFSLILSLMYILERVNLDV